MGAVNSTSLVVNPPHSPQLVSDTDSLNHGDVIFRPLEGVYGRLFNHFGIYIGEKDVIHFTCDPNGAGLVERVDYETFAQGKRVHIEIDFSPNNSKKRPGRRIAQSALNIYYNLDGTKSDWETYNNRTQNCEHFTSFCATGLKYSKQTKKYSPSSRDPGSFSSSSSSSETSLFSVSPMIPSSNRSPNSISSNNGPSSFPLSNMGPSSFSSLDGARNSYSSSNMGSAMIKILANSYSLSRTQQ